ncbi:MAG: MGMT family protein [Thermoproteus sp.]|nr:MGMT family protein [Thermoproteus sp.]
MVCAKYGPVALEYTGRAVRLVGGCEKYIDLEEFVKYIKIQGREPLLALLGVRRGSVTSYSALARALGVHPRAVGRMLAANKFPVLLPCHRVVRLDGQLGGYSYGVHIKRALLEFEGVELCGGRACRVDGEIGPVEGDLYGAVLRSLGL